MWTCGTMRHMRCAAQTHESRVVYQVSSKENIVSRNVDVELSYDWRFWIIRTDTRKEFHSNTGTYAMPIGNSFAMSCKKNTHWFKQMLRKNYVFGGLNAVQYSKIPWSCFVHEHSDSLHSFLFFIKQFDLFIL